MKLPNDAQSVVDQLYAKNVPLAQGTDDQRRVLTKQIAETVRFRLGPAWGWKSAGTGRPPSKDAIALKDSGKLWGFDLFNGSTREPNRSPDAMDITGQTFIEVPPIDHLSGVVEPPQPPNQPPAPPAVDLTDILRRLEALEKPRPIVLRAYDGRHFLCAESGGGGIVVADRTTAGPWETFTIESKP